MRCNGSETLGGSSNERKLRKVEDHSIFNIYGSCNNRVPGSVTRSGIGPS